MTVALGALVLGGGLLVSRAQPPPPALTARPLDPLEALEAELMPKFRAAVASRDWTKARALAESCRIGAARCPRAAAALEQLRAIGKLDAPTASPPDRRLDEIPPIH